MKISILDDYFDTLRTLDCFAKLAGHEVTVWNDHVQDVDALAERLRDTEALVLIRERTEIRAAAARAAAEAAADQPAQRLSRTSTSTPARGSASIVSSNLHPGTPSYAAAELTWALVLAAMRQIPQQIASLQGRARGRSASATRCAARRSASTATAGSASVVAGYGQAFGMDVLVWAREASRERARGRRLAVAAQQARRSSQSATCSRCTCGSSTRRAASSRAADLARMKPTALLVNTSRAPLIEPGALVAALRAGRPGMAAVDVYEEEPLRDSTIRCSSMDNVVCTPHIGYVTREEYELQFADVFDQIIAYAHGYADQRREPRGAGATIPSMTLRLNPYLSFRDNAREAMTFYQSVFGGELTDLDVRRVPRQRRPGGAGQGHALACSRRPTGSCSWARTRRTHMDYTPQAGVSVSLSGDDEAELRGYWDRLSEGGAVAVPLEKAPWGDTFGMCVDRFGINWMVNAAARPAQLAIPCRCATAAASVRLRTSSLERMRETWTLAVFSAMNSSAPISRLVAPRASSPRTWRSRGVRPNGSSPAPSAAGSSPSAAASSTRSRARAARPSSSATSPADASRRARGEGRLEARGRGLAVAGGDVRLGLAPAGDGRGVGAPELVPRGGRRGPARRIARLRRAGDLGVDGRQMRALDGPLALAGGRHAQPQALQARPGGGVLVRVAEVAGAQGRVGLHGRAGGGHAGRPPQVLAAELDAVERVLDGRAGRREVARPALELGASAPATPRNCGSMESAAERSMSSSSGRTRRPRRAEGELGAPQAVDERAGAGPARARQAASRPPSRRCRARSRRG